MTVSNKIFSFSTYRIKYNCIIQIISYCLKLKLYNNVSTDPNKFIKKQNTNIQVEYFNLYFIILLMYPGVLN